MDRVEKWDRRFLELARLVSTWSKDPSTKCGAVICKGNHVIGMGYNGFPPAIADKPALLHDRPSKYARVIHAEMNAIFNSYEKGLDLRGATLYTYPPGLAPSCERCTAHVVRAGVTRVVHYRMDTEMSRRWNPETSLDLYAEAGVEVVAYEP